jgi:thiamine-phosphate pyrophosphorylase
MRPRQSISARWLVLVDGTGIAAAERLPRGSGLLLLTSLSARGMRRLRAFARQRDLAIVSEGPRSAVRVHNSRELLRALNARTPLILLSPLFPTSSHPGRSSIPPMRAAALARLGGRRLIALGGMNEERFASIAPLGFVGWAGISAWLKAGERARPLIRLNRLRSELERGPDVDRLAVATVVLKRR